MDHGTRALCEETYQGCLRLVSNLIDAGEDVGSGEAMTLLLACAQSAHTTMTLLKSSSPYARRVLPSFRQLCTVTAESARQHSWAARYEDVLLLLDLAAKEPHYAGPTKVDLAR